MAFIQATESLAACPWSAFGRYQPLAANSNRPVGRHCDDYWSSGMQFSTLKESHFSRITLGLAHEGGAAGR